MLRRPSTLVSAASQPAWLRRVRRYDHYASGLLGVGGGLAVLVLAAVSSRQPEFREASAWLLLAAAAGCGVGVYSLVAARRLRDPSPPGCCQACGYDLRATPDRCPECGTVPAAASRPV